LCTRDLGALGAFAWVNRVQPPFILPTVVNIGYRKEIVGSVVTIMHNDSNAHPNIAPAQTCFIVDIEVTVDSLLCIKVPFQASPVNRIYIIYVFDYAVHVSIEGDEHLDWRSIPQVNDSEADVGQMPAALSDLVGESRDQVPGKFLVNLFTTSLQLSRFESSSPRMFRIVSVDVAVAIEAKGKRIVEIAWTFFRFR
jgi:hypothetical protein